MKFIIAFLLLCCSYTVAFSQGNDLLVLKRRWHVLERYYPGKEINFTNVEGQRLIATITAIQRDTVYLLFTEKRVGVGIYGLPQEMKMGSIPMAYNYKDIKVIHRYRKGSFSASGYILMTAGVGNLFLGFVNGLYYKDKPKNWYSKGNIITSAALILSGFALSFHGIHHYRLGRKYKLVYYGIQPPASATPITTPTTTH